jgi:hypothetical protein
MIPLIRNRVARLRWEVSFTLRPPYSHYGAWLNPRTCRNISVKIQFYWLCRELNHDSLVVQRCFPTCRLRYAGSQYRAASRYNMLDGKLVRMWTSVHCSATPSTVLYSLQAPHGSSPSSPNPEEKSSAQRGTTNRIYEKIASCSCTLHGRRWEDNRTLGSARVLPSETDQYQVSSRTQTYRHSILICMSSWLIFSLSHNAVPIAMFLNTLSNGNYTYHLLYLWKNLAKTVFV